MIFHKSPSKTSGTTSSSSLYGAATQPTPSGATTASSIIQTMTTSNVGSYLADSSGAALYTYGGDSSGTSNVSGSLLASWPAYQATSTSSLPANVTVIKRSDGTSQYAYKGLPLYTFVGDSSGQVTGDGVADFHVAKP